MSLAERVAQLQETLRLCVTRLDWTPDPSQDDLAFIARARELLTKEAHLASEVDSAVSRNRPIERGPV